MYVYPTSYKCNPVTSSPRDSDDWAVHYEMRTYPHARTHARTHSIRSTELNLELDRTPGTRVWTNKGSELFVRQPRRVFLFLFISFFLFEVVYFVQKSKMVIFFRSFKKKLTIVLINTFS